jgi:hypothetical protein
VAPAGAIGYLAHDTRFTRTASSLANEREKGSHGDRRGRQRQTSAQNLGFDAGSLSGSQQSRGGGKWNSTRRPLPSGRNGSAFRRCSSGRQKSIWKGDSVGTWDQRFDSPFLQR